MIVVCIEKFLFLLLKEQGKKRVVSEQCYLIKSVGGIQTHLITSIVSCVCAPWFSGMSFVVLVPTQHKGYCPWAAGKRCWMGCPPRSFEEDNSGCGESLCSPGQAPLAHSCAERLLPLDLLSLLYWDPVALQPGRWTAEHMVKIGCSVWGCFGWLLQWGWCLDA